MARRSVVRGAAWAAPALAVVAAAPAVAASPQASPALGSLCTGAMDLNTDTIEVTVAFGVLVPAGATVPAGTTFTYAVSIDPDAGAPAALPVSGLSATTSVSGSGGSYVYTITVTAPYTNSSGADQFFAGGVAWVSNPASIGATITTADSGPVTVDSDGTCYYSAY